MIIYLYDRMGLFLCVKSGVTTQRGTYICYSGMRTDFCVKKVYEKRNRALLCTTVMIVAGAHYSHGRFKIVIIECLSSNPISSIGNNEGL